MNSYELSRRFFDWSFENPEKITPTHVAMYFFIIEHCNRLGWKEKFGLPTNMVKDAIGIKNYRTYTNALNDLVEFGFIKMVEKSKNQYSSNIIAIANFTIAHTDAPTKALDKALQKHSQKHCKSIDSIDKPLTIKTNKQKNTEFIPPSLSEAKEYFKESGYTEASAERFFNYYNISNWIDSKGNKVKNWKSKAIAIWFKDENKQVEIPEGDRMCEFVSKGNFYNKPVQMKYSIYLFHKSNDQFEGDTKLIKML